MNTKANKTDTKTVWTRTVVISLAAVVVAACGSAPAHRSNGQQPSGLHLASATISTSVEVAYAMPIGPSNEKQQLSVFNTTSGKSKNIGSPETYADVVLSPTGHHIAAAIQAETRTGASSVLLYDTVTESQATYTQPSGMDTSFLVWSPDGKYVALLGSHIIILDAQGHVVSSTVTPPMPGASNGGTVQSGGGYQWSSDSASFSALLNGYLLTAYTDGRTSAAVQTTAATLSTAGVSPTPTPSALAPQSQGNTSPANTVWKSVSTDGSAMVYMSRTQGSSTGQLSVRLSGQTDVIAVPYSVTYTRGGELLSVTVMS